MSEHLRRVRRFNRLLTQRIGLLAERYLGSALPFAQARLLYEVAVLAPLGTHHLRRLLVVDGAALSRGLAALERRRLVRRRVAPGDARHRVVEVTGRGRTLLATLDRRADARIGTMTAGLDPSRRQRLVAAVEDARRLLLDAFIHVERRDERDPDVQAAHAAYLAELARRFGHGVDRSNRGRLGPGVSLVVVDGRRPVGCGVLRRLGPGVGEIKRMWLHPDARGLGVGGRLLAALEREARRAGQREVRLDTNRRLREAIALYEHAGYRRIARYNQNPDATHFYAKYLARPQPDKRPNSS